MTRFVRLIIPPSHEGLWRNPALRRSAVRFASLEEIPNLRRASAFAQLMVGRHHESLAMAGTILDMLDDMFATSCDGLGSVTCVAF